MSSLEASMKPTSAPRVKELKRPSTANNSLIPNKKARNDKQFYNEKSWASYGKVTTPAIPKNAVVKLNEIKPGLEYCIVEHSGPVHNPTFVIEVTVNGEKFIGRGRSKKAAKHQAADAALRSFVQFKDTCEIQATIKQRNFQHSEFDFTSDDVVPPAITVGGFVSDDLANNGKEGEGEGGGDDAEASAQSKEEEVTKSSEETEPTAKKPGLFVDKNPVMLLNELRPGLQYDTRECGTSPSTKRFIVSVTVEKDGKSDVVEGSGSSKKLAKQACARSALTLLYNMSFTPLVTENGTVSADGCSEQLVPGTTVPLADFSLPQVTSDRVAKLIMDKFGGIMEGNMQHSRRKVLAGIVMTTDAEMEDMRIISISTGTKCINGEHMSVTGNALNDCHAEIISRRCLVDYLYRHLEKIAGVNPEGNDEDAIFTPRPCGNGYKLKDNIRFHLYINTAPCGDARIFSPHEQSQSTGAPGTRVDAAGNSVVDRHPNRRARGQLRTKIESGEGTIPVKSSDGIQTWDGVLQGSRLLTMSCSDKVARWNILGAQGSLLSHFIEPVYLYSLSLGSLFHPHHLFRAVAGRIQPTVSGLPPPFKLNIPRLNLVSSPEVRQPGKAPNYSVNWTTGLGRPEIVDAMKGKDLELGTPSRLCKASFFRRWRVLAGKLSRIARIPQDNGGDSAAPGHSNGSAQALRIQDTMQYDEAKLAAVDFQEAKKQLFEAFKKAELGNWIKKPMEQDEFITDD